jgi:hypothetical protein
MRNVVKRWLEKLKRREHLEDLGIDERNEALRKDGILPQHYTASQPRREIGW